MKSNMTSVNTYYVIEKCLIIISIEYKLCKSKLEKILKENGKLRKIKCNL